MKILVVRRDNIGDLVLTTPVFTALRKRFPEARIEALVNSYNAPVLDGHPDVDRVHAYTKAKHLAAGGALANIGERLAQVLRLRSARYDTVIVATPGFRPRDIRLARWVAPAHIAACVPAGRRIAGVDLPRVYEGPGTCHQVEDTFRTLEPLGITGAPPAPTLAPRAVPNSGGAPFVAVHLSARKASSRWPEERFAPFLRALHERHGVRSKLLWSPGPADDPRHPGDDEKAARVLAQVRDLPVEGCATPELGALIAAIAACQVMVCSDGGAMHIAAALGKPIVCFFGDSDARAWHPWNVDYRLLQPPSRSVADVAVEEALAAFAAVSPRPSPPP